MVRTWAHTLSNTVVMTRGVTPLDGLGIMARAATLVGWITGVACPVFTPASASSNRIGTAAAAPGCGRLMPKVPMAAPTAAAAG